MLLGRSSTITAARSALCIDGETAATHSESNWVGAGNSSRSDDDSEQDETEDSEDLGQGEPEFSLSVVLDTHEIESANSCNEFRSVLIEEKQRRMD